VRSLVFEIDAQDAERLGDRLIDFGALSVASEDALGGTPQERPLFDEPGERGGWSRVRMQVLCAEGTDANALLGLACDAAGIAPPAGVAVEELADQDWVRKSRLQFEPIRASERIWVVPSWCALPDPGAINIVLDPGLAFGTGSHATTRLCIGWLDRTIRGGETVLDYGCGSGILALAAMKLGASRAIGVDIDPQALAAAAENAARNQVACEFFDAGTPIEQMADIVVANILTNALKVLSPLIAAHTRAGGRIALSGILESQAEEVARTYDRWFEFDSPAVDDGWVLLSAVRDSTPC
jgi:ribosomal protein L11 methyltransferase